MFVKFECETNYCGERDEKVVEFPDDTTDEELDNYSNEYADENAMSFRTLDELEEEEDEEDEFRDSFGSWEKLEKTKEEIEMEWGVILNP